MEFILQTRRSVNETEEIQEWLYQDDNDGSFSEGPVSPNEDLNQRDLGDEDLDGFGGGFEDNGGDDEDSQGASRDEERSMADSDEYASPASSETDQEGTPEYDYHGCEGTSLPTWRTWW